MTKVELALILKTIDANTTTHTYNYCQKESKFIQDVYKLKNDIINQYQFITAEDK